MSVSIREKIEKGMIHRSPTVVEWSIYGLCCLIVMVTMYYTDNYVIFVDAIHHIDALVNGVSLDLLGINSLPYGVIHQWIVEIWSLPVCICHYALGLEYSSAVAIIWYKLCIVFFGALCIIEFKKLCHSFGMDEGQIRWMVFLLCSNILVFLPVFHIAQTDVLYLFLILKGYTAYINHDKKKFVICFMLANSFKFISIFIFIPLVLLSEKKVYKILCSLIVGGLIIPIQQIWYRIVNVLGKIVFPPINDLPTNNIVENAVASSGERVGAMNNFYSRVFDNMLYIEFPGVRKEFSASFMIFIFALICLWCYIKSSNDDIKNEESIFVINAVLLLFFLSTSPNPYWIILLYPFLYLAIFMCTNAIKVQLMLEKIFTCSLFLSYVMSTYWVFGGAQTFDGLVLNKLGICKYTHYLQGEPNIAGYLNKININLFMPIVTAVCLAAAIGMLYVFYSKETINERLTNKENVYICRASIWTNLLLIVFWFASNVVLLRKY